MELYFTFGGLFPQFAKFCHSLFVTFLGLLSNSHLGLGHCVSFVCVDFSVDLETWVCSVSVCVDTSTRLEADSAASSVCVGASMECELGDCGVEESGASLGRGGLSFGSFGVVVRAE